MSGVWKESFSEKHQRKFWKNKESGEVTWHDPHKADKKSVSKGDDQSTGAESKADKKAKSTKSSTSPEDSKEASDWVKGFSEKKQANFWKNKITGESTWKDPTVAKVSLEKKSDETPGKVSKSKAKSEATEQAAETSEWTEHFSAKHGKAYWKNSSTGKSTFTNPHSENIVALSKSAETPATTEAGSSYNPDDWEEKFDKKKEKKYWKNKTSGKATYTDPSKGDKKASGTSGASSSSSNAASVVVASSDWEKKFSEKKQKPYWKNKTTGESSWTDPTVSTGDSASVATKATASVSDLWEEKFDKKSNRKYWKNKETGKSTFKDPTVGAKKADEMSIISGASTVATSSHASDWVEKYSDKHKKKYWKNSKTGLTSWTAPPTIEVTSAATADSSSTTVAAASAEEWVEGYSEKYKRLCWKNSVTGKTTYTRPIVSSSGNASSSSAERKGSASSAAGAVKSIVNFAYSTAVSEAELDSPLHIVSKRMLLQLRGAGATTELDVLRFTTDYENAIRQGVSADAVEQKTEAAQTFKLSALTSLICNEIDGVVTIALPGGGIVHAATPPPVATTPAAAAAAAASDGTSSTTAAATAGAALGTERTNNTDSAAPIDAPAAVSVAAVPLCSLIALYFPSPAIAQAWFSVVVKRLDLSLSLVSGNAHATIPGGVPRVLNMTSIDVVALSDSEDLLIGSHSIAAADPFLLSLEMEWLLPQGSSESGSVVSAARKAFSGKNFQPDHTTLPVNGLLLFKVLAVHAVTVGANPGAVDSGDVSLDSSSAQMKGWMSCWVRVDRAAKTLTFYDQGPGSAPSLSVNCETANLHIPDLTDPELECECNLYHCAVRNSPTNATMSIAIKLPSAVELFKWVVALSGLLDNVTYCSGGIVNSATQPIDYLQEQPYHQSPSAIQPTNPNFLAKQQFLAECCLGALEGLAERKMCSSYMRHVQLTGAQIKSARFLQMNQRIVLLMKGTCSSLTEGSVLLSVNGLSTVSTPASTILKFIADFPRQMRGELSLWKFPRMEFHANVVKLAVTVTDKESVEKATELPPRPTERASSSSSSAAFVATAGTAAFVEDNRALDPKGKINKVMIQKRNSILKMNSGMELTYEGIEHPAVIASLQKELKALDLTTIPATTTATAASLEGSGAVDSTGFTLAEFIKTPLADVNWLSSRLMIASGNISILVTGADGLEVSLCRLQLSSCSLKLVYPAHGTSIDHLTILLRDSKTQVAVQCSSLTMLVDLTECLLIAMKMMGSFPADLSHLYDQSVHWSNSQERREKPAAGGTSSLSSHASDFKSQSLLMQAVIESAESGRESVSGPETPLRSSFHVDTPRSSQLAASSADINVLQAAEELEATLSSLHLPANFPTHTVVEKEMVELFKLNNANHRLLAEFLTLQFDTMNPVPETAIPASRHKSISYAAQLEEERQDASIETKYPSMGSADSQYGENDSYAGEERQERSESAQSKDPDSDMRDKLMAALGAGGPKDEEKSSEKPREEDNAATVGGAEAAGEGSSGGESRPTTEESSAVVAVAKVSPPSPKESPPTPPTVRRSSVQMRSGSVMVSNVAPITQQQSIANRRATFRKSAITHSQEQAAVLLMSQLEKQIMLQSVLNKADRVAIAVLLNHLRNSAEDLVNIAVRFTSPTDVKGLAHFVAHRLCVYWSADQRHLEDIVFAAAKAESPRHSSSFREAITTNMAADHKAGLLFNSQHSLLSRLGNANTGAGSFLQALLSEIASRMDVVVYVQSLCGGISVESITEDSGVADLCARVVEPFCRRFEAAVVSGTMPIVLKHTLRALVRCETAPIKPMDFIVDTMLPHILTTIVEQNKIAEKAIGVCLSDEQIDTILDRVRDMVNMCFNQEIARHLKICLSDQAALSRSKWYIERSLQYIVQDSSASTSSSSSSSMLNGSTSKNISGSSPIAKLCQIEQISGKTSAIHGLVCVRPSELFFILQSMELSDISAAPLSAYSRELSQAITHMHTSDLLQRLHSELRLTVISGTTPPPPPSGVDGSASGTGILDAMRESGIPFLDREVTFLLYISPHATYHAEFMHHYNDDSAVPKSSIPVKGLSSSGSRGSSSSCGGSGGGGSFNSTSSNSGDLDLSALLTSESVEESQEAHALASIRWLVQAARSALKSMYDHNSVSIRKRQSTVRELQELRSKLLSRKEEIANILADWKKISMCTELCSNYKAQISLLLEKYKHHKKAAQLANQAPIFWNSTGVSSSSASATLPGSSASPSASGSEAAPSTVAQLEASATIAAAGAAKDAEVQAALSKIVMLQLKLEGTLQLQQQQQQLQQVQHHQQQQQEQLSAASAGQSGSSSYEDQLPKTPTAHRSASKLAALAANSPMRSGGQKEGFRAVHGGLQATGGEAAAARTAWTVDDMAAGMLRSRAPNPLHVVMQSVFATSHGASPRK